MKKNIPFVNFYNILWIIVCHYYCVSALLKKASMCMCDSRQSKPIEESIALFCCGRYPTPWAKQCSTNVMCQYRTCIRIAVWQVWYIKRLLFQKLCHMLYALAINTWPKLGMEMKKSRCLHSSEFWWMKQIKSSKCRQHICWECLN